MAPKTHRLATLLEGFFISKQAEGCSPKTVADYRVGLGHFGRWCDASGKDPARPNSQDVKAFLASLRTQPSQETKGSQKGSGNGVTEEEKRNE